MSKSLFPKGIIKIEFNETIYEAEYVGKQNSFDCIVCGKGENCYTFNIFDNVDDYNDGKYETWGFGKKHLPRLITNGTH